MSSITSLFGTKSTNLENTNKQPNEMILKKIKKQQTDDFEYKENNNKPSLKIIPIGGTTTVQKNMYVYECGNDIIVVDCGIGFPDSETPGVDIIIPDFTYVLENRHRVKAVLITHGHDDHRSSLPYLLREHKFEVYAIKFVKALIEKQLEEYSDLTNVKIRELDINRPLQLGCFAIHAFKVNHSIPDTLGFAIDTPQGRIFHNADYKFDFTPVMDKPFDIQKAATLASEPKEGVLALLSDCLGSTHEGFARSEKTILETFNQIMRSSRGRQLFITTVSSNISRIYQAIQASQGYGRKIVIAGRSIRNTIQVARELKYIDFPDDIFVDETKAARMDQSKLTYIIAGAYGQKGSGLSRVAINDHKFITMSDNAVIVFSADPIPNAVSAIDILIEQLYRQGAEVYYSEIQNNLHVSGHGSRGDMVLLANIVKPRFYVPIGGNIKHMRAYSEMIQDLGIEEKRIFQLLDGQEIIFENGKARLGQRHKLKEIYVDGSLVGDVGYKVIEERKQMSNEGMVVVTMSHLENDAIIDVVTRGFIFVKENKKLLNDIERQVQKSIKSALDSIKDDQYKIDEIKRKIERDLEKFLFKETGRNPLIVISIM